MKYLSILFGALQEEFNSKPGRAKKNFFLIILFSICNVYIGICALLKFSANDLLVLSIWKYGLIVIALAIAGLFFLTSFMKKITTDAFRFPLDVRNLKKRSVLIRSLHTMMFIIFVFANYLLSMTFK